MKRPAGYLRLSLKSDTSDIGIERQQQLVSDLAQSLGLPEPVWYSEVASAFKARTPRPQFNRMVEAVRAGQHDTILSVSVDRLYRRLNDLTGLTELVETTGVQIRTVYSGEVDLSTADGLAVARILASLAERESAKTGERVKAQVKQAAVAGRPTATQVPFGWRRDPDDSRRLVPDPDRAPLVVEVFERIDAGQSLNSVAKWLTDSGVPTPTGRAKWHHASIQKLVALPRHAGWSTLNGQVVADLEGGGIVDRDLWLRVQQKLADPARKSPSGQLSLLSGLLACGRDGCSGRPRAGVKLGRPIYRCPECWISVARSTADAYAIEQVAGVLAQHVDQIREAVAADVAAPTSLAIERQRASLTALAKMLTDRQIGPEAYAAASASIEAEIRRLEQTTTTPKSVSLAALAAQADPVEAFERLDDDGQRDVMEALVQAVVLMPGGGLDIRWV